MFLCLVAAALRAMPTAVRADVGSSAQQPAQGERAPANSLQACVAYKVAAGGGGREQEQRHWVL